MNRDLIRDLIQPRFLACGALAALLATPAGVLAQDDLLPDLIVRPDDLYDNEIVFVGVQKRLRFATGTGNIGDGPLHLYGGAPVVGGNQEVWQRVYDDQTGFTDMLAGEFVYHPGHQHIHFEDWTAYRLREILPGDGVGAVLTSGTKRSFCILDTTQYFCAECPEPAPVPGYTNCQSTVQGLSVGWVDIYSKFLADQHVVITDVPPGTYWLEVEVDPEDRVVEIDETNNVTRIKVTIDAPETPDAYEPNNSLADVAARIIGANNSPALGPCDPSRTIQGLGINTGSDVDYFLFYMPGTGNSQSEVRLDWDVQLWDPLMLELLDVNGTVVETDQFGLDEEVSISLDGYAGGWYFVRVSPDGASINLNYSLTITPAPNAAPAIETLSPPSGDTELLHALESLVVEWNAVDPENDPTWVRLYFNAVPILDGGEFLEPTSLNTPGEVGQSVVNSAELEPGSYWVYSEVTDGGTTVGDWSEGTVTWVPVPTCEGDMNGDQKTDVVDFSILASEFGTVGVSVADLNFDGVVDIFDFADFAENFGCDVSGD